MARDVTEASFAAEVIEASHRRPVVIDFWATWCTPCHQLSPTLERVASRHADEVDLVKVDIDQAQSLARQYRVQSIPAVKAFRDGQLVAEFLGNQPEVAVEQFFATLAPSAADRLVARAQSVADGDREALLREALEQEPGHAGAVVGLAGLLAEGDDREAALQLLQRVPADPEAQRLSAQLRLAGAAGDLDALRAAAAGEDPRAVLAYGRGLAAAGRHAEALDRLLAVVADPDSRDAARAAIVEVFTLLGDDDPLVKAGRRRLSAALF